MILFPCFDGIVINQKIMFGFEILSVRCHFSVFEKIPLFAEKISSGKWKEIWFSFFFFAHCHHVLVIYSWEGEYAKHDGWKKAQKGYSWVVLTRKGDFRRTLPEGFFFFFFFSPTAWERQTLSWRQTPLTPSPKIEPRVLWQSQQRWSAPEHFPAAWTQHEGVRWKK